MPPRPLSPVVLCVVLGLLGGVTAAAAAPITWTGAVDGSWHTAGNWDLARVPGAGDDVVIPDLPGTAAVTFDSGTTSIQSLACDEVFVLSGGTLDVAAASTIGNTFTLSGAGTALTGPGDVAINGGFTWAGGTMSGSGTVTIGGASVWTVAGPNAVLARFLNSEGHGSHVDSTVTITSPGMLRIRPGGVFVLPANGSAFAGTGTIQVHTGGLLKRDTGAGTCVIACSVVNAGTIRGETGTLQFTGGLTHGGTLENATGSILLVTNLGMNTLAGSAISAAGQLRFAGGSTVIDPATSLAVTGTLSLSSPATLTLGPALSVPTLVMDGGTLTGAGHLTVTAACTYTGGTMSGSGLTTIPAGVSWTVGSAGVTSLTRTLENSGTCTSAGTVSLTVISPGVFINRSGGVVDIQSATLFAGTGQVQNQAGATIRKTVGAGQASISCPLVNGGLVRVEAGTLRFTAAVTHNGTLESLPGTLVRVSTALTSSAGSTLSVGGNLTFDAGTSTVQAGTNLALAGTCTIGAATVNLDAGFAPPALVLIAGGNLLGAGNVTVGSSLEWSGGTMGGAGSTTVSAGAVWTQSASATAPTLSRLLVNEGTCSYTGSSNTTIAATGLLRNAPGGVLDLKSDAGFLGSTGVFENQAGALLVKSAGGGISALRGVVTNQGTLRVLAGKVHLAGTFTNFSGSTLAGGTYDLAAPLMFNGANVATLDATLVLNGPAATLQDQLQADVLAALANVGAAGTLAVRGRDLSVAGLLNNDGTVEIGDGAGPAESLEAQGGYRQNGGSTRLASGTLVGGPVAAPTFVEILGGSVTGSGQLSGLVTNSGTVAPGDSVGGIVVSGDYVQTATGRLEAQLGGAATPGVDYDRLLVTGNATLNGELAVSLVSGFQPSPGDSFDVVATVSGAVAGAFATSNLPIPVGSECLQAWYEPKSARLGLVACGPGTITWTGGAGTGSWHDAGNWDLHRAPISGDAVLVPDLGGTAAVVYSAGATALQSLDCDENLTVSGGVLEVASASAIAGTLALSGGTIAGTGDLTLSGAFQWSGTAAMTGPGTTTIDSTGTWTVPAGATPVIGRPLVLRGSAQNDGALVVPPGLELRVAGGTLQSTAGSSLAIGGVLAVLGGDVAVDSLAAFAADSLYAGAGSLVTLEGDGSHRALHLDGGRLGGAGDLTFTGSILWSAGTLEGTGRLIVPAGLEWRIDASGPGRVLARALENAGTCRVTGSAVTSVSAPGGSFVLGAGGELDLQGDAGFGGDGEVVVLPGGRIVKSAGAGASGIGVSVLASGSIAVEAGTLSFTAPGPFTNQGSVTVGPGATLAADSGYAQAGGSTVLAGGTLASAAAVTIQGGSLQGTGTVAGDLVNAAQLAPGAPAGAITVLGDFTQTASGQLNESVGGISAGSGFDVLTVSGAAQLDGSLVVSLAGGFVPSAGDTFDIVAAGSVGGRFAVTNLPIGSGASCLDLDYRPALVRLSTLGITITRQPEAVVACAQGTALFSVSATGPGTPAYQWRRNAVAIPGATNDTLLVSPVTPADAGSYDVVVVTACDSAASLAVPLTIGTCIVTIYVDATRPAGGNGASWATAFRDLQAALAAAAASGETREIWVADGRYRPDPSSQSVSFNLLNKVALYGGFAGTETNREQRNPAANRTVLSGDLAGNDGPNFANNAENSRSVVRASGVDSTAVLDGFVVTGGNALANGAGIAVSSNARAIFRNCAIDSNFASNSGAGLRSDNSSPRLVDCTFRGNRASGSGGGLSASGTGVVTLAGGAFIANTTTGSGGAISLSSAVAISGAQFSDNTAQSIGGAVNLSAFATSVLSLSDCGFTNNRTTSTGGGIGGAVSVGSSASLTALRCSFTGNSCNQAGSGTPNTKGGAIGNLGKTMTLTECGFTDNAVRFSGTASANACGGGAVFGPAVLDRCTFVRNETSGPGTSARGGAVHTTSGVLDVRNSRFVGNLASGATPIPGGAVAVTGATPFTAVNCLFNGNTAAGDGGAIFLDATRRAVIAECTVSRNATVAGAGGGLRVTSAASGDSVAVAGSILWMNVAGAAGGEDAQVSYASAIAPRVNHCDVSGLTGALGGAGNVGADPMFTDADGADDIPGTADDDFSLRMGSPVVDAGDNTAIPAGVATDLAGAPRLLDDPCTDDTGAGSAPIADMGAFEFQGTSCALDVPDPALAVGVTFVGVPAPNPTTGPADIRMRLAREAPVRVDVMDVAGRRVHTLLDALVPAGEHVVRWDGRGDAGQRARPGLYFVRFRIGSEHLTRRVLLRP